jgi:uncharacterized RDD family membrane protein YckC
MQKPTSVAGQRFASYIVDSLVISLAIAIFWLLLTDKIPKDQVAPDSGGFDIGDQRYAFSEENAGNRTLWTILSIATVAVVSIVLPGIKGTSPGRALTGIRVVDAEGRPPGILRAFGRWVFWVVDHFPWFVPLVGWICVLASDKNQRVGDMVTKTYTVKKELAGQPLQLEQPGYAQPGYPQPGYPQAGYQHPLYAQPPQPAGQPPGAGWHPDPRGEARLRWWDGSEWTDHTAH